MRKTLLLAITLFSLTNLYSQEVYFLTGSNFTKYNFESRVSTMTTELQSGSGTSYEMGYLIPFKESPFSYSFGATLNAYNAVAGSNVNSYQWDTKYLGGQCALIYTCTLSKSFSISAKFGSNLSSIIYGKQNSNGILYNITNQKEFSGVLLSTFAGIQTNYTFNNSGYLSLGYGYSNGINITNSLSENLTLKTNQILFGIHFKIKN
nr:hypothetical protein [uncultured Flavobacterium sp.]